MKCSCASIRRIRTYREPIQSINVFKEDFYRKYLQEPKMFNPSGTNIVLNILNPGLNSYENKISVNLS